MLPTQSEATRISGVVTGLLSSVTPTVSGTFARKGIAISAAEMNCTPGTNRKMPTSSPMPTARGTERRVKRHSAG